MAQNEAIEEGNIGAFFDVDGTLAASNLVDAYIDFKLCQKSFPRRVIWLLAFAPKLPVYALLDRMSRAAFNRAFFASYQGVALKDLSAWAQKRGACYWSNRLFCQALEEAAFHRNKGHKIALVTGGLSVTVQPLDSIFAIDSIAAAEPESLGGRLTGKLTSSPLSGQAKAEEARRLAKALGVDLTKSYSYADSFSDLKFLECAGHPVAVNPDRRLRKVARKKGWPIRRWDR